MNKKQIWSVATSYVCNKNLDDEIKNIAVQILKYCLTIQFLMKKQKTRPRTGYEWIGKTMKIKSKKLRTLTINIKMPHVRYMTTREEANFCSNTFLLYSKTRLKKFQAAKPLAFLLQFLFRREQNHYSKLTSKIMKMCDQILKKKTAPQYNSYSLICKKNEKANNSPDIAVRLLQRPAGLIASIFVWEQLMIIPVSNLAWEHVITSISSKYHEYLKISLCWNCYLLFVCRVCNSL